MIRKKSNEHFNELIDEHFQNQEIAPDITSN